jgi:hypothetical protein
MTGFYETMAHVLALLLLAIVWESHYLDRLRQESDDDRRFWKKRRVRIYVVFLGAVVLGAIGVCTAVLSKHVDDNCVAAEIFVLFATGLMLVTMFVRVFYDIKSATE